MSLNRSDRGRRRRKRNQMGIDTLIAKWGVSSECMTQWMPGPPLPNGKLGKGKSK